MQASMVLSLEERQQNKRKQNKTKQPIFEHLTQGLVHFGEK